MHAPQQPSTTEGRRSGAHCGGSSSQATGPLQRAALKLHCPMRQAGSTKSKPSAAQAVAAHSGALHSGGASSWPITAQVQQSSTS